MLQLALRGKNPRALLWTAGFVGVTLAALGVPAVCLQRARGGVARLRDEIEQRSAELEMQLGSAPTEARVVALELDLAECERLAREESEQLAELSAVAHASGARVTSIESLDLEVTEDGLVEVHPKALELRCSYRQLAEFLGGVRGMRGEACVLDFSLRPAMETVARESGQPLRASLTVAWFGSRPRSEVPEGETP